MDLRHPIQAYRERRYEQAVAKDGILATTQLAHDVFVGEQPSFEISLSEMPNHASIDRYVRQVASAIEARIGETGLGSQVEFDPKTSAQKSLTPDRLGRPNSPAGWMPILRHTPTVVFNRVTPE
jgi:hypothetical protein